MDREHGVAIIARARLISLLLAALLPGVPPVLLVPTSGESWILGWCSRSE